MSFAVYAFSAGVLILVYVLVGYPCLLALLSLRERKVVRQFTPRPVTIVLPVHNGERWIADKLESIRQLDYPLDSVQVVVIDDGSTDRTREVALASALQAIEVVSLPRGGKAKALNAGLDRATGEILVFTDVRQQLRPDSVRRLVACFADPKVGVVSGELIILEGATQRRPTSASIGDTKSGFDAG